VLYFSGTGNSLYIATKIAEALNDKIVSIADLVCNEQYYLKLDDGETIGFVYPVYACAPADIVTDFIKKVKFEGYTDNYIYSVFNCAGSPEYTSRIIRNTAAKAGLTIQGFFDVLMPGNYITQKKHLPPEKGQQYLNNCDNKIDQIVSSIRKRESNYKKEKHSFLLSYGLHKLAILEKTEKFTFGDECVRCGKCVDICPMSAITMTKYKPVRDQNKCAFCLGCVNICPTRALNVSNKTQGNPQYINPHYDGKACNSLKERL
ncbi:EFR1 family ferrodoxin, partial [Intestinibacter sp.]|uniref:EFR1 family ferrodoxin n=1 Tax=Intestinibacter sp. TaxID=1965304 RepID=UPI003F16BA6D